MNRETQLCNTCQHYIDKGFTAVCALNCREIIPQLKRVPAWCPLRVTTLSVDESKKFFRSKLGMRALSGSKKQKRYGRIK